MRKAWKVVLCLMMCASLVQQNGILAHAEDGEPSVETPQVEENSTMNQEVPTEIENQEDPSVTEKEEDPTQENESNKELDVRLANDNYGYFEYSIREGVENRASIMIFIDGHIEYDSKLYEISVKTKDESGVFETAPIINAKAIEMKFKNTGTATLIVDVKEVNGNASAHIEREIRVHKDSKVNVLNIRNTDASYYINDKIANIYYSIHPENSANSTEDLYDVTAVCSDPSAVKITKKSDEKFELELLKTGDFTFTITATSKTDPKDVLTASTDLKVKDIYKTLKLGASRDKITVNKGSYVRNNNFPVYVKDNPKFGFGVIDEYEAYDPLMLSQYGKWSVANPEIVDVDLYYAVNGTGFDGKHYEGLYPVLEVERMHIVEGTEKYLGFIALGKKAGTTTLDMEFGDQKKSITIEVLDQTQTNVEVDPEVKVEDNNIDLTIKEDIIKGKENPNAIIDIPAGAVINTLIKTDKDNVNIDLHIPNSVASVTSEINLNRNIFEYMDNKVVTFSIKDETGKEQYAWTFDNKDLKPMNVNLAMEKLTVEQTADIKNYVADKNAVVLNFKHSGELPSQASVRVYVGDQYKAGDKVYFYYYNEATKSLRDEWNGNNEYTVDKDGYVTVKISHCSQYVLKGEKATQEEMKEDANKTPITENPAGNDQSKKIDTPNTGDTTNATALIVMMIAGAYVMMKSRKELSK